ncbi:MAG: recombinase RecA, partial [Gammaproteobacteria bacterium]
GKEQAREYLQQNPEAAAEIEAAVREKLLPKKVKAPASEPVETEEA